MKFYVLSWLLFFLAPGGCPIYSIDLATLEVPTNDFQNELTLQSMLSSELRDYRNGLIERVDDQMTNAPYSPPRRYQELEWFKDLPRDLQKATRSAPESDSFLGTNLFGNYRKNCFSTEDIALISARKDFELLVPKSFPQSLLTDSVVYMLLRYFNTVNQIVKRMSDEDTRLILQRAFYDALGGYLRYYLVPMAQISYYAGRIKLNTVERLVNIYQQCKTTLNTNGNGWRTPSKDIISQFKVEEIEPVKLPKSCRAQEDASSCTQLEQSCISQEPDQGSMIVTLPRLEAVDDHGHLTNIYLPLRKRRIYNLRSPRSEFVLVKFFQTLTSCHRFQGVSQANYNHQLLAWIKENLEMHYADDVFYPGLGGILQIQEMLSKEKNAEEESRTPPNEDDALGYPSITKEDSRKISRSAIHWQETSEPEQEQEHQDEWLTGLEKVQNRQEDVEECRECDNDETLIWCIAAFLTLLLLLILLIICCCMRRGRRKRVAPTDAEAPPPKEKPKIDKEPLKAKEPDKDKKKKEDKADTDVNRRYYYSGSDRSTSQRSVQGNRYPDNPELDSFTSTSSLGCQFNRKCIPMKFSRAKGGDYYAPDKSRDQLGKQVSAFKLLSDDSSPSRASYKDACKTTLKSALSVIPSSESEQGTRENRRQRQTREEARRKKLKDFETSRKKESHQQTKSSEDKKQSSPERRSPKQVRIVMPKMEDTSDDPLLQRKKSEDKPDTSRRLKGGATVGLFFNK
uniref:GG11536 n=1 Tax=Drosophila erecta TaxID=7220 RepID=B3P839_DROER